VSSHVSVFAACVCSVLAYLAPRRAIGSLNRRVGVETRCAEMSLTDDFAKVQLQAAKATKDLQEPRLGARPRRNLSFGPRHTRPPRTSHLHHGLERLLTTPHLAVPAEYRTVTAVSGPLVILDKVKVSARAASPGTPLQ